MTPNGNWFFEISKDPILAQQYANHIKQKLNVRDTCVFPGGGIQYIASFPSSYKNLTVDEFKDICKQLGIIQDKPKEWYVKITEDNLYYVNAYRHKVGGFEAKLSKSKITNYYMCSKDGHRYNKGATALKNATEITHYEFTQICHDLGIPTEVKPEPTKSDLGQIEFLKDYPEILENLIKKSSYKSLEGYKISKSCDNESGGFSWSQSEESKKDPGFWAKILNDKKPEYYYTLYPKESKTKVEEKPEYWYIKVTDENRNLCLEYNKYKGVYGKYPNVSGQLSSDGYTWSVGYKQPSIFKEITTKEFKEICGNLGITVDNTVSLEYNDIPIMPVNGFDELKQIKQKIDIGEIPVKKRVLI